MTAPLTSWRETEASLRAAPADGAPDDMHDTRAVAREARVSPKSLNTLAARLCERVPGPRGGGWRRLLPAELVESSAPLADTPWRPDAQGPLARLKKKEACRHDL